MTKDSKMLSLGREDLLKKDVLKIEKVQLTKTEHTFVRQMTGRERDTFEQSLIKKQKGPKGVVEYNQNLTDFRAKLAVNTLCNAEGDLLLTPKDVETLSTHMSAYKLELIVNKAQALNNISAEDKDGLVKN